MCREKTELEKSETETKLIYRLQETLFLICTESDFAEAKRMATATLRGELHGREIPRTTEKYVTDYMKAGKNQYANVPYHQEKSTEEKMYDATRRWPDIWWW